MNTRSVIGFTRRLINCLTDGGNSGSIDKIVVEIGEKALSERLEELKNSSRYVHPEEVTLNEKLDENGVSRFRLAESEEGVCMVPDKKGFWTRVPENVDSKVKVYVVTYSVDCSNDEWNINSIYLDEHSANKKAWELNKEFPECTYSVEEHTVMEKNNE